MGNKHKRKKRYLKKIYKIRGKRIRKSSLCSVPDSVTNKEICTQDVCLAATDTNEVEPSDCIEMEMPKDSASFQGQNVCLAATDTNEVDPSDCIEMEMPKDSASFQGQNVCLAATDTNEVDPSDCIEMEMPKDSASFQGQNVCLAATDTNEVDPSDCIEMEMPKDSASFQGQNVCLAATDTNEVDPSDCIEMEMPKDSASFQGQNVCLVATDTNEVDPSDCIEIEMPKDSPPSFEGRRIINLINVYTKLQNISTHGPFGCTLKCVDIIHEKQVGLLSIYTLQCKMCNVKFYISSDEGSVMDVNNSAVLGTVAIGCGHSQLQEFSAALSLPLMGQSTYKKCHDTIAAMWDNISIQTMNDAAKEEREIAILEDRVDTNGTPIIDVIVDGCWSKRSYKKNYSALSGAAVIIGKRTGKILYLGVKNKYCCICARAQCKNETPRQHNCFKNYSGPSTGMESTILVEGFKCSLEMHGLIYGRMISDGDSSTYTKIIEARPYSNVTVQKIECKNHIMRNMCNKLAQLRADTKYPSRLRKVITDQKIISIRGVIRKAMEKHTSDSESEKRTNIEFLYNDILLAHRHAFGDHSQCKIYFCKKTNEKDNSACDFLTTNLWSKICQIMSNVASHAPSLVHNVESNKVENFNSKIAKLVGGKRINFSSRGAYESRCKGALISHNTRALLSQTYKRATGLSPRRRVKFLEERRMKRSRLYKKCIRKKNRFLVCKGGDLNYGENCSREDLTNEMMEKEKSTFLKNLQKSDKERENIEKATILQSASSEWLELRRKLLTASNFGRVINRRPDISCHNLVKDLLYKDCIKHVKSIKHGVDHEKIAIEQLEKQEGIKIDRSGLFVDENLPYLGASPDGICKEKEMIIEIKCPISAHELSFEEAVNKKKIPFFRKNKFGDIIINTNHNWYYQIQGQLHITKKSKCLFGLWLGEKQLVKTELIQKDDKFWTEKMEKKLTRFYLDCILPELVDPRYPRKMPIRDPDYIQEAMKTKTKSITGTKKKKVAEKKNEETNVPIDLDDVQINAIEEQKEHEDETIDKPSKINKPSKKEKVTAKKNEESSVSVGFENVLNNDIEEQKDQENQQNDRSTRTLGKKRIINKRTKNKKGTAQIKETNVPTGIDDVPISDIEEQMDQKDEENDKPTTTLKKKTIISRKRKFKKETAKKNEETNAPTDFDKVTNNDIEERKDQQEDDENGKATKTLKKKTIIDKKTKRKKQQKKKEETSIPTGFNDVPINDSEEEKEQEDQENLNSAQTMKRKSSENWDNDEVVKKPRQILKVRQLKFDEF